MRIRWVSSTSRIIATTMRCRASSPTRAARRCRSTSKALRLSSSTTSSIRDAASGPPSTSCSISDVRNALSLPCSSIAADASCRSSPRMPVRRSALHRIFRLCCRAIRAGRCRSPWNRRQGSREARGRDNVEPRPEGRGAGRARKRPTRGAAFSIGRSKEAEREARGRDNVEPRPEGRGVGRARKRPTRGAAFSIGRSKEAERERTSMNSSRNPQLNRAGDLTHLLTLEGLPADVITDILDTAEPFASISEREVKKVPLLRGKAVFNLFFENSTRTRTTFEIAAKRLSADVINLNIGASSTSKGETLLDTIDNLVAMQADMFVVRHSQSGAPHLIAAHLDRTGRSHVHVVNAGDGRHAHPTQGLLDLFTIRHYKQDFTKLKVAIVGDILHSRVARSDIHALTTLGAPEIRVVGPK